jgi:hypothetical protein
VLRILLIGVSDCVFKTVTPLRILEGAINRQFMDISDKKTHAIVFGVTCVVSIFLCLWQTDLLKDAPTTLGTIGSFATGYGVLFAVIELRRAQAVSMAARLAAERVFHSVTGLITAREITECQSVIQMAVASLDERRAIPSSTLQQVIKLYSQIFHVEMGDEKSEHRKNRSMIVSYYFNARMSTVSNKNTKRALLAISGHLAQLQGQTKNFSEY